jgi:hypothetical protein
VANIFVSLKGQVVNILSLVDHTRTNTIQLCPGAQSSHRQYKMNVLQYNFIYKSKWLACRVLSATPGREHCEIYGNGQEFFLGRHFELIHFIVTYWLPLKVQEWDGRVAQRGEHLSSNPSTATKVLECSICIIASKTKMQL